MPGTPPQVGGRESNASVRMRAYACVRVRMHAYACVGLRMRAYTCVCVREDVLRLGDGRCSASEVFVEEEELCRQEGLSQGSPEGR